VGRRFVRLLDGELGVAVGSVGRVDFAEVRMRAHGSRVRLVAGVDAPDLLDTPDRQLPIV
jgi:hypothetical protein